MDPAHETGLRALWSELEMDDASFADHRSSATAFRGLVRALKKLGHFETVAADVPPVVASVMRSPPLGGAWVPDVAFYYVLRSTKRSVDDAQFRAIARTSVWSGPVEVMRPFIESMLRLFDASPHGLLSRVPQVMGQQMKGATFTYDKLSDTAAEITIAQASPAVDNAQGELTRVYWEEVLCSAVELCNRTREGVESRVDRDGSIMRTSLRLSWT